MGTFGVKRASDEKLCPSTLPYSNPGETCEAIEVRQEINRVAVKRAS